MCDNKWYDKLVKGKAFVSIICLSIATENGFQPYAAFLFEVGSIHNDPSDG